jgi:hypothetical protein
MVSVRRRGLQVVWLMILTSACSATSRSRDPSWEQEQQEIDVGVATAPSGDGRISLGFVLESTLRGRRTRPGQPTMYFDLGNGATVIDGDYLQVHLRTSRDAHLYLAFCSQNARNPQYPGLKVFPDHEAIRVRAYETTIAPHPAAEIRLDDKPGQETLYLILSRFELSTADSGLAQVIAAARQGIQSADCGRHFREAVAGPRKETGPASMWNRNQLRRMRAAPGARPLNTAPEADPVVEIQRGGDIVWRNGVPGLETDPDGIVVLRYTLTHVAAR